MQEIWYCDECGTPFKYPYDGEVSAGFGCCNECLKELRYDKERN